MEQSWPVESISRTGTRYFSTYAMYASRGGIERYTKYVKQEVLEFEPGKARITHEKIYRLHDAC